MQVQNELDNDSEPMKKFWGTIEPTAPLILAQPGGTKKSLLRVMLSCLAMIDILLTGILYSLYYLMILVIGNAVIWVMLGTFLLNSASKLL